MLRVKGAPILRLLKTPPGASRLGFGRRSVRAFSDVADDDMAADQEKIKESIAKRQLSVTAPHIAVVPDALSPVRSSGARVPLPVVRRRSSRA